MFRSKVISVEVIVVAKGGSGVYREIIPLRGAPRKTGTPAAGLYVCCRRDRLQSWQNRAVNLTGIRLRLARRGDAPTLAAMSRDLIETGLGWHYRTERIAQLLGTAETVSLVATEGALTAGFAIMTLGEERAHLVLLAVRADHHRRGIGRRMAQWLVETAVTAGIATLHVELRAQNKAAYAFYRALGFEQTLRIAGYYRGRETAIRMMRMLRAPGLLPMAWRPPTLDKQ
jgi:[ribosomal protein S18]-alanine N-acetyltransferase